MIDNIYTNPLFHGILGGIFVAILLYLLNKNKKKKKRIDMIPVLIFSLLVWFASSNYQNTDTILSNVSLPEVKENVKPLLFEIHKLSTFDNLEEIPGIGDVIIK